MNWTLVFTGQLIVLALMLGLYFAQRLKGDAGVIDLGWTSGIALLAILFALSADGYALRRTLVAAMASLWAGRLCYYIFTDRLLGRSEDERYRKLRDHWGAHAQRNFFLTFMSQAFLVTLFALPFIPLVGNRNTTLTLWDIAGIAVWLIAVAGETAADGQLAAFRRDPANKGKTCRIGLWRYSRHPNYFFEWLHWWAYVVMAIGLPGAWLTLFGPILMLLFLFKITGIPFTEKQALSRRGEDYRNYQNTTSVFIPWPPTQEDL